MFINREKLYQAYHAMLSFALSWALVLEINQYYDLRVNAVICALFALLSAGLVFLFDLNRRNSISYILLMSIIPIVGVIFWRLKLNPLSWLKDLINWCRTYNGSDELYVGYHARFIVFIMVFAGVIICYLLMKQQSVKVILAGVLFVLLVALSVNQYSVTKLVVGICIFYILTIIVEVYGIIYNRKAGRQSKREGILYLAPVCLILAILSIGLPSKPEPIQWNGIKNLYRNAREQLQEWGTELNFYFGRGAKEFTVALTGYSDESGVLNSGSELIKDPKVALKVTGSQGSSPIYLIGSVSDTYTGFSWEKSKQDFLENEEEYRLDYSELVYALSRLTLETLENNRFLERRLIKTEYNHIKTKTYFYPLKTSFSDLAIESSKVDATYAGISLPKMKGKGTTYESVFYEMNLQGKAFAKMLIDSDSFSYEEPLSLDLKSFDYIEDNIITHDNVPSVINRWDFYEVLEARANMIKRQYTELPEELPNRVRELAWELTKNYDTQYEKLKAIETFLRDYKYTLEAVEIPKGSDFADYFLFESQRGYCTSYATAMAVLGRCIGVPTRFVEGFVAKFDYKDEENMFPVKNSQAHAWCEAYFEGVGWIPFEATAPFYSDRYKTWSELPKENSIVAPDYSGYYNQQPYQNNIDLSALTKLPATEQRDELQQALITAGIILAIIIILVMSILIYFYTLMFTYKKNFEKADYSGKMYMLFVRILWLLKREGYVLNNQETILMLAKRVNNVFVFSEVAFTDIANIFMRYRYADKEVTKEEFEKLNAFHKGLSGKRQEEDRRFKMWLEEFLFLTRKGNL